MIELDPNSWDDLLFWYEDEPEKFNFIIENEETIKMLREMPEETLLSSARWLLSVFGGFDDEKTV